MNADGLMVLSPVLPTIDPMAIRRIDHVGIIVSDLDAAVAFFAALGFEGHPPMTIDDDFPGRVNGIPGSSVELVMMHTPDGQHQVEVTRFISPADEGEPEAAQSNRLGIRHIAFVVDDIDAAVTTVRGLGYELVAELVEYEGIWRLCYIRGPEGIIVELAEELGVRDR